MSGMTDLMRRLQLELSYAANITRQENAQKLLDYYAGEQLEHLDDVLAAQFSDPDAQSTILQDISPMRLAAYLIRRLFSLAKIKQGKIC